MLKKIINIFILVAYWLCFVPCLVYYIYTRQLLRPNGIMDYFMQYTVLLFVLILIYCLIHHIFDTYYMKNAVKSKVRKITMKRQLERFERGEISLEEAQNFKTFTQPKSPKVNRRSPSSTRRTLKKAPAPCVKGDAKVIANKTKGTANNDANMQPECSTAAQAELPTPPPPYSETVKPNEVIIEINK